MFIEFKHAEAAALHKTLKKQPAHTPICLCRYETWQASDIVYNVLMSIFRGCNIYFCCLSASLKMCCKEPLHLEACAKGETSQLCFRSWLVYASGICCFNLNSFCVSGDVLTAPPEAFSYKWWSNLTNNLTAGIPISTFILNQLH